MIKVAVLDDYQNAFEQIVNKDKYENKFNFKIFNEPFIDENEALVKLTPRTNSIQKCSTPQQGQIS